MKTKFKDFLNESSHYKKNEYYFYKNQYMSEPKKVHIYEVNEYESGEIESITIVTDNNTHIRLLPYEFKYLSEVRQEKTDYEIVQEIGDQIFEIVGESPKQITDLFDFIKNKKDIDVINITFTEEVKDSRNSKFNINKPLLIKGRIFGVDDFKFEVVNIRFNKIVEQESDYNEYFDYIYEVKIKKLYID